MSGLRTILWRWWYRWHPTPSKYTKEQALEIAKGYGLECEVQQSMKYGCTPDEALQDWDIFI